MPERATDIPLSREPSPDPSLQDRRASSLSDRREQAGGSARRPAKRASVWARYLGIAGRDLVLIIVAVAAIVFAVSRIHPIFANSPPIAEVLTRQAPIAPVAKAVLAPAPKDSTETERLVSSPQFEADRSAFASDLVRTGRMSQAR